MKYRRLKSLRNYKINHLNIISNNSNENSNELNNTTNEVDNRDFQEIDQYDNNNSDNANTASIKLKKKKKRKNNGIGNNIINLIEDTDHSKNQINMLLIDELFNQLKEKKIENKLIQEKLDKEKKIELFKQRQIKKEKTLTKVNIINPEAPLERIDKQSGLPVYKAHILKVGEGGGTPLCPFDCNCCF